MYWRVQVVTTSWKSTHHDTSTFKLCGSSSKTDSVERFRFEHTVPFNIFQPCTYNKNSGIPCGGPFIFKFFFVMIDKTNLVCIPISGWLQPYHTALDNYNAINGRFECGLRGPNATPWSSTLRPSFTTDREAVRCGRNRGRRCLSKRALKSSQRSEGGST
jgi:hypothetical protein